MLQMTAVNMQSHNETVKLWKEAAEACYAEAAELREQVEKYAARIAVTDETIGVLTEALKAERRRAEDAERRAQAAEAENRLMRQLLQGRAAA